jgi:uncharacterized protein with HEPN domain
MSNKNRDHNFFIDDILDAIKNIKQYTKGYNYESFKADKKTIDAVVRNFEIIGEATKKLSDEIKKKNPDVEWKKIAGFRDVLIHDYFGIDYETIWQTIKNNIPELEKQIKKLK